MTTLPGRILSVSRAKVRSAFWCFESRLKGGWGSVCVCVQLQRRNLALLLQRTYFHFAAPPDARGSGRTRAAVSLLRRRRPRDEGDRSGRANGAASTLAFLRSLDLRGVEEAGQGSSCRLLLDRCLPDHLQDVTCAAGRGLRLLVEKLVGIFC